MMFDEVELEPVLELELTELVAPMPTRPPDPKKKRTKMWTSNIYVEEREREREREGEG